MRVLCRASGTEDPLTSVLAAGQAGEVIADAAHTEKRGLEREGLGA